MTNRNTLNRAAPALLAIALFFCSTTLAQAALVLIEVDSGYGAGSGTLDTTTDLEWLDWTVTTSISYNDMIPMLGAGGAFEGWRYATQAEVETLFFTSAGIVASPTATRVAQINALQNLLGVTDVIGTLEDTENFAAQSSYGIYDIPFGLGRQVAGLVLYTNSPDGSYITYSANSLEGSTSDSFADSGNGHILVRPVPEPASMLMMGGGLMLLLQKRRAAAH